MTPARSERESAWFALPIAFARDPKLLSVPPATRYLFLELVALALEMDSGGRIDGVQLMSCGRGMRGLRSHCGRLSVALLLRYDPLEDAYYILDDTKWLRRRQQSDTKATVERHQGDTKATSRKSVSAAPTGGHSGWTEETPPRGGARVEKERKKEREERTPSGSVRSSSAQAAPRVAGGAAQPTPEPRQPLPGEDLGDPDGPIIVDGRKLRGAELIAHVRAEVENGRKKNPAATGIDTSFSKYDPNRPIEPITSTFMFEEDPE
jgi:hypothetical protein